MKSVLKDSQVVLATCHSSGGRQMFNQDFDVVIIDEATQAIEAVSSSFSILRNLIFPGLLDPDFQSEEVDLGW